MTSTSDATPAVRSQIPHGVQDRFLLEAARRRQAEATLREFFVRWGYQEIIPPTIEYDENLAVGAGDDLKRVMYRFFDHDGHTLALRADFTPQLARMAATKLFDQPMPLRCCYVGSVFRQEEPQAGRKREFTQAGIELIGADTAAADAEVVALAIAAMQALMLQGFQINLGQMAFFRAVTAGLTEAVLATVRQAIDHKNRARLEAAVADLPLAKGGPELLCRLPDLAGGPEILHEARRLSNQLPEAAAATAALDRLAEIYQRLVAYGVADHVILDLGEVRGMDYYTGITFRGVTPGLGWPIISGGRYDGLVAQFGRPMAAVGMGLSIERALLVQTRQGVRSPSAAPHLLVHQCEGPSCLALVRALRTEGLVVEVDPLGLDQEDLYEHARQRGASRVLYCQGGQWLLVDEGSKRAMTEAALLQEAKTWNR
jgi:ATP phosphoribosyltransferase regulatory subunit